MSWVSVVVRDALANVFFPGTSTIQTRAKYFLIVPRIFKEYEVKFSNKKNQTQTG